MKVLIIGSGGREHALVKAVARSPKVSKIIAAPGNPGMEGEAHCFPITIEDLAGLVSLAKTEKVDLTIVGPELPLTMGIVDRFEAEGLRIFGPNERAAILEASKTFTKDFLSKYHIPTAKYESFTEFAPAEAFLKQNSHIRWVVKADGLAAGKGVYVTQNLEEALAALNDIFIQKKFGAQQSVVIEEFLDGEEASFMAICDGRVAIPLGSSQDHKRLLDDDRGPNTGGMGAYSPAPIVDAAMTDRVMKEIIYPTLEGMAKEDRAFSGILYAGLMICHGNPYVLEFNVRFGDPETQVVLPRLKSDWVELFEAALDRSLDKAHPQWLDQHAVCVVLGAEGYPESPKKGAVISGLEKSTPRTTVYHAGTARQNGQIVTAGGRVLGVTSLGSSLKEAIDQSYVAVGNIHFEGMQYRKDIGVKGLRFLTGS